MEVRAVYDRVYARVRELVSSAGLDLYDVDEIVYVGGSASLPGLDETLAQGFPETLVTPFTAGTVVGGGVGDPTTIISRGCALQARILATLPQNTEEEREVRAAFASGSKWTNARATSKTIGMLFPEEGAEGPLGGQWIPTMLRDTVVPARRTLRFDVDLGEGEGEKKVGFEVWEVKEGIKIEKVKPPKFDDEEDPADEEEEEEEEEEIEVKEKTIEKENLLTALTFAAKAARQEKGRWTTKVEAQFIVHDSGALEISAWEVGPSGKGEKTVVTVAAV